MTIAGYDLAYVITLAIVSFGALTFSVLTLHYWRTATSRRDPVFAVFTLMCASAFLINVLVRMEPLWETTLACVLDLATGLIPPLLLHLVLRERKRRVTLAFYALSVGVAMALVLDDVSTVGVPLRDQAPAIMLAAASGLGLLFVDREDQRLRLWYRLLLGLTVVAALAGLFFPSPITVLAPDYLLLAFFCVTLYYRERLIFFDLLIKRGVFFCFAVIAMAVVLSAVPVPDRLTIILMVTPLLLFAPWADSALAHLVDRLFLRRRYSPTDAERLVLGELQKAVTEDDLLCRAERSLSEVFGGVVEVRFAWPLEQAGDEAAAVVEGLGQVILKPRASGIPYMTDDRRLLDSLAHTLGVVLENVRFREQQGRQQEREQQLRLLASRAELKALRAQINPHFLFNALNAIAGLIPTQPQLADETVEQLAEVFRYTLRKSENEWVRLDEEIEFIRAYLRIEQARFGDRLNVQIDVAAAAAAVPVPTMVVQPLIENAIKHGLPERRGAIGLRAVLDHEQLQIEVSDNGPGFPPGFSLAATGNGHSHGLRNINDRLEGYYGNAAKLSWRNTRDGTRVLIQIPNDTNADRR